MKRNYFSYVLILLTLGCGTKDEKGTSTNGTSTSLAAAMADPSFLPLDTTDLMIGSYAASLGADSSTKLHSWSIDAEALRHYLDDPSIKGLRISLSHTMTYINNGNYGVPSGFSPNALTIVVAGESLNGDRIPYQNSYLLNRAKPCPPICLPARTSNERH
ncbi:hypothetical protein [uncultured Pedobacter sp.]|uniref:hypothetical protein n=1 Tax=uncultured Pedobacter sp. TaxID=246139 RepID=UPI002637FFB0|nr:hypothetical protein [uncultured Pedobacter sp.]